MANLGLLDGIDRTRLRGFSKTMFGNADRIEVAAAVARCQSGMVNGQELHELLGISPPRVRAQLLALASAGLVEQLPRMGQRLNYGIVDRDDPFWTLISEVAEVWGSQSDPD